MKQLKMFGLAAVAAMALTAFLGAGGASATTLEEKGVIKNSALTITMSLEKETSSVTSLTDGSLSNTCTESHIHWDTSSPFTGTKVTGPVTSMSFAGCTRPVTVHKPGQFYVEYISGTTNGTLFWENADVTEGSPIGTLTCTTPAAGTDIGTITGKASGQATVDIHAVLNCGFLAPSATWEGKYWVTSPEGLGVVA